MRNPSQLIEPDSPSHWFSEYTKGVETIDIDRIVIAKSNLLRHGYAVNYKRPTFNLPATVEFNAADVTPGRFVSLGDKQYNEAVESVIVNNNPTCTHLQVSLGLGYPRSSRFLTQMEQDGVVGPKEQRYSRRVVLMTMIEWRARCSRT